MAAYVAERRILSGWLLLFNRNGGCRATAEGPLGGRSAAANNRSLTGKPVGLFVADQLHGDCKAIAGGPHRGLRSATANNRSLTGKLVGLFVFSYESSRGRRAADSIEPRVGFQLLGGGLFRGEADSSSAGCCCSADSGADISGKSRQQQPTELLHELYLIAAVARSFIIFFY